jgi:hypothetical protein
MLSDFIAELTDSRREVGVQILKIQELFLKSVESDDKAVDYFGLIFKLRWQLDSIMSRIGGEEGLECRSRRLDVWRVSSRDRRGTSSMNGVDFRRYLRCDFVMQ